MLKEAAVSHGPPWVKYSAADFLDGVRILSIEEELAYRRICDFIYSIGGPLSPAMFPDSKLARMTKTGRRWKKIKAALLSDKGKLFLTEDGSLMNPRCERELHAISDLANKNRLAGRASAATGKSLENLKPFQNTRQNTRQNTDRTIRRSQDKKIGDYIINNLLGRCAPPRAYARSGDAPAREAPPSATQPSPTEIAEVAALVQEATDVLTGRLPKRNGHLADPVAYAAAVKDTKRETWLNELAAWVGEHFDGEARMQAWEAIEQARASGSRKATPPHVRKLLDTLDSEARQLRNEAGK